MIYTQLVYHKVSTNCLSSLHILSSGFQNRPNTNLVTLQLENLDLEGSWNVLSMTNVDENDQATVHHVHFLVDQIFDTVCIGSTHFSVENLQYKPLAIP